MAEMKRLLEELGKDEAIQLVMKGITGIVKPVRKD